MNNVGSRVRRRVEGGQDDETLGEMRVVWRNPVNQSCQLQTLSWARCVDNHG